jgi:glycosyltransferase involved in cell wall biosynthesis
MIKGMVSIVVPTHGYRHLKNLQESVDASLYQNYELIIVNMGKERSWQRNYGIDKAQGEFLLWLDSDQAISPFLLGECVKMMKDHLYCNGIYIPEVIVADSFFGKVRKFEREFYTGTAIDCVRFLRMYDVDTGDYICPRFDETLHGPEDSDFDRQVKPRKLISKNVLFHYDDISPVEYFKKKSYYGKSLKKYLDKNPNDKCLDPFYRCFGVFTESGKWRNFITHPILSIGIFYIIMVRGIIYVSTIISRDSDKQST